MQRYIIRAFSVTMGAIAHGPAGSCPNNVTRAAINQAHKYLLKSEIYSRMQKLCNKAAFCCSVW